MLSFAVLVSTGFAWVAGWGLLAIFPPYSVMLVLILLTLSFPFLSSCECLSESPCERNWPNTAKILVTLYKEGLIGFALLRRRGLMVKIFHRLVWSTTVALGLGFLG